MSTSETPTDDSLSSRHHPSKSMTSPASEVPVNRYLASYIMGIANRLSKGASSFYRAKFNLGMSEWRALVAIGTSDHRIVREVAEKGDLDYAAASKSLRLLEQRGLVEIEQTNRRGRAAIAKLTPEGMQIYKQMLESTRRRHKRLLSSFSEEEVQQIWSLLRKIEGQIEYMNFDG